MAKRLFSTDPRIPSYLNDVMKKMEKLGVVFGKQLPVTEKNKRSMQGVINTLHNYGIRITLARQNSEKFIEKVLKLGLSTNMTGRELAGLAESLHKGEKGFRFFGDAIGEMWGQMSNVQKVRTVIKHPLASTGLMFRQFLQHPIESIGKAASATWEALKSLFSSALSKLALLGVGLGGIFSFKQAYEEAKEYEVQLVKMSAMFGGSRFGANMVGWVRNLRTQLALTKEEIFGYVEYVHKFGLAPAAQDLRVLQGLALRTGNDFNRVLGAMMEWADPRSGMAANLGEIANVLNNQIDYRKLQELQNRLTSIGGLDIRVRQKLIVDFFKEYGKYADQYANTTEGLLMRIRGVIKQIETEVGMGILGAIKPLIDEFLKWMKTHEGALKRLGSVIGSTVGWGLKTLGAFFRTLLRLPSELTATNIDEWYKNSVLPVLTAIYGYAIKAAEWIRTGLIPGIKEAWNDYFKPIADVIASLGKIYIDVVFKDNTSLGKLYGMAGAVAVTRGNFKVGVPLLITAGILKATDLEEKVKQSELNRQRAKTARKWLEEGEFTKEELPPDYRKSLEYFEWEIPTVRVLGLDVPLANPGISGPGLPGGGFNPYGVGFAMEKVGFDMLKAGLSTPGMPGIYVPGLPYFVFNMKDVTIKSDNPKELVDSLKQQADKELRRKGINP